MGIVAYNTYYKTYNKFERRTIMKRHKGLVLFVVVLLAVSALLAGCGGNSAKNQGGSDAKNESQPVTINVLSSDDFAGFRKSVIPEFEAKYPNIKVNFMSVGYDSLHQKEVTALESGGDTYDVIDVDCIWTPEYVTKGYIIPVNDRITQEMKDDIVPAALDILKYKDNYYGLPMFNDVLFFYYNEDLLKQAGINEPPKTWDELIQQTNLMKQKGLIDYGMVWGWAQAEGLICYYTALAHSFGGDLVDSSGKPAVNTPQNVKALQFMVDSIANKVVDPASITYDDRQMLNVFSQGRVPFGMNWSFAWSVFNDSNQSKVVNKIKVGLAPAGTPEVKSATCAGSMGLAVTSTSKHADEAWKFIEFLAGKDIQKKQAITAGALPIWKSLYEDKELQEQHPALKEMSAQLDTAYNRPSIVWYNEFSNALQVEIQNALNKSKTPQQALDDAQKKIDEIMNNYGGKY